jgi:predicted transcriptional regulator
MPSHPLNALTRINSTVKELFIYLYDLSPLDLDLLFIMIKEAKPLTLEELSNKADRDKSTVFRSVQKLVSAGICIKETRTIREGGYYHVYSAVDMETFKVETETRVKDLQKSLDRLMKKFESDMHNAISSFYEK